MSNFSYPRNANLPRSSYTLSESSERSMEAKDIDDEEESSLKPVSKGSTIPASSSSFKNGSFLKRLGKKKIFFGVSVFVVVVLVLIGFFQFMSWIGSIADNTKRCAAVLERAFPAKENNNNNNNNSAPAATVVLQPQQPSYVMPATQYVQVPSQAAIVTTR